MQISYLCIADLGNGLKSFEKNKAKIFKSLITSRISFTGPRQPLYVHGMYVHVCAGVDLRA